VQPATGGRRRAVVRGRELFPLAWRRNTLAVQTGRGIGLVSTRGGAIEPLCRRFWPFVRAGSSVSWLAR
jgi:hypothetical protein